jgi:hypothetical protein
VGELVAELCGAFEVADAQERVVVAQVGDPLLVEAPGQPLASVDVDLAVIRHPALDAHVHEAELGVDEVEVVMEAPALSAVDVDGLGPVVLSDLEAHAGLDGGDDADDPLFDPVALGDRLGQVVLALGVVARLDVVERDDGATGRFGEARTLSAICAVVHFA